MNCGTLICGIGAGVGGAGVGVSVGSGVGAGVGGAGDGAGDGGIGWPVSMALIFSPMITRCFLLKA